MHHKATHLITALIISCLTSCSHRSSDDRDHSREAATESEDHHHDDDGLILLNPSDLATLGVETEEAAYGPFAPTMKVAGEITAAPGAQGNVAARQAGLVKIAPGITSGVTIGAGRTIATVTARGMSGGDPNESAYAAYEAARREVERITPLHAEGIVSTRDYNAAMQQLAQAKAALGNNSGGGGLAATAPVAGTIATINVVDGEYVESGQTIATISSNSALTLRVDVPQDRLAALGSIAGARLRPSDSADYTDIRDLGGHLLSSPASSAAEGGYIPVYFTLDSSQAALRSGTYCDVYLVGEPGEAVVTLPCGAVSEQQGRFFVYAEVSPGHYRKIPVETGGTDGLRTEIRSGVKPGDKIVCRGTTYVRLAETSGVVPEGHSHTH